MKIVVSTPTGQVGSRVVQLLVQAGVRPTVLVRDPGRLPAPVRERVDAVTCDQGDGDAVVRATRGAEALFWVDPPTGDEDPVEGYARMGANAARAMRENAITRTVFLSSGGAELRSGAGEIDGLARTEELLDATGRTVLHLRAGYFFSNLLGDLDALRNEGVLRTPLPLDHRMPWVDPRDIGDIAAARLLSTGWSGRQVQAVQGPEDLSFAEVAAIVSQAVARPVRAERITQDELRSALRAAGLGDKQVEGIVGMTGWMLAGFVPEDTRTVLTTTPTPLAAWAHAHLAPLL
ncbi:NAD(P)H-binding protein [Streptomyces iconiensis]|uniref:NAD(P)H-binding protein n=1 Tax=Streptomyces iconiensis TaxID=1384038 RepID=A0ABT7A6S5_9ACTN|nr:NAD(P)H-binding protein [Streptomyces iconiensis]MDJ1137045.1 NAD(P)H-binding protein [Streptomyces iconiensis]